MLGNTLSRLALLFGRRVHGFPHERVPDGTIVAPHHSVIGGLFVLLAVYWAADGENKPATVAGLAVSAFGWSHMWAGAYPVLGATVTLAGLLWTAETVLRSPEWSGVRWTTDATGRLASVRRLLTPRTVAFVGALVALDDVVEHAFGVWTPLDWLWSVAIAPALAGYLRWLAASPGQGALATFGVVVVAFLLREGVRQA